MDLLGCALHFLLFHFFYVLSDILAVHICELIHCLLFLFLFIRVLLCCFRRLYSLCWIAVHTCFKFLRGLFCCFLACIFSLIFAWFKNLLLFGRLLLILLSLCFLSYIFITLKQSSDLALNKARKGLGGWASPPCWVCLGICYLFWVGFGEWGLELCDDIGIELCEDGMIELRTVGCKEGARLLLVCMPISVTVWLATLVTVGS